MCIRDRSIYHVEAAIAAVHAHAATFATTNWRSIISLYDQLLRLNPSAVVQLNRAIAVAQADGATAGSRALEAVKGMEGSHLYHAARGDLLRAMGRADEARAAYALAATLTRSPAESELLRRKQDACA